MKSSMDKSNVLTSRSLARHFDTSSIFLYSNPVLVADDKIDVPVCRLLQISYSKEAIFIGAAPKCVSDIAGRRVEQELAALYVIGKGALCEPPTSNDSPDRSPNIYAAVYFASRAWYRSVADTELTMVEDKYEPFNSYINPVRPQGLADLDHQPFFVMKVCLVS